MKKFKDTLIEKLIAEIAPLNNNYRFAVRAGKNGREILEIMWDVGEILKRNGVRKIHPVAWKVYGKAQGIRKSFITRDFLSYCFRIRRFFKQRDQIGKEFPTLKGYSLFREAFPLLENPRFKLKGKELVDLKKILNSAKNITEAKESIVKLKKRKIGISNPRTQRLVEFKYEAQNFFQLYNELKNAIVKNNVKMITKLRESMTLKNTEELSSLVVSLTQEGLKFPQNKVPDNVPLKWKKVWEDLNGLTEKSIEDRNRLRRLIPPSYLMRMAEMMNVIYNDRELKRMKEIISS